MFYKLGDIIRAEGVRGLARRSVVYAYRRGVRPCITGMPIHYAGIPICHDRKWSDRLLPIAWLPDDADQPDYEATLVAGLNEAIRVGDSIVVVGGGLGVTVVVAALRTGPSGTVQCFEGSRKHVRLVQPVSRPRSGGCVC